MDLQTLLLISVLVQMDAEGLQRDGPRRGLLGK